MKKEIKYVGAGFWDLLLIAFIVLKLSGIINWSWFWVLAPLWIPFALIILILIIYTIVAIVLSF